MLFYCPVCKKQENFENSLELKHHIASLPSNGVQFSYPLVCIDPICEGQGTYNSLKSFIAHINKYKHCNNAVEIQNTLPPIEPFGVPTPANGVEFEIDDPPTCILNEYKSEVRDLLLSMYSNSGIPHVLVTKIVQSFERFVFLLKTNVTNILNNRKDETDCQLANSEVDGAFNRAQIALRNVNTPYKAKTSLFRHPLYVEPEKIYLSFRREAHLSNGDQIVNRLVAEHSIYVPIIPTVQALFQDSIYASKILDEKLTKSPDGVYADFTDGKFSKSHKLFSDPTKISLRFQIFYDGMGTTNCLRGHSASNSIGIFYFIIENLPKCYNTCYQNVHVFALCHIVDLKKHGFQPILHRFMEDIVKFETEGIMVSIPGRGEVRVFGSISQFSGDCLAKNEIYGLTCSFSHDYNCSICYAKRDEFQKKFREENFTFRSKEEHEKDLRDLTSPTNVSDIIRGVKQDSVLNHSNSFHTAEDRSFDLMHLVPEGIVPYELGCVLYEFIHARKLITLEDFNDKLSQLLSTMEVDKPNTPPQLNPITYGKGLSPKLAACEMMALLHNCTYVLGEVITDEDDLHWKLLLQLQTIVDILFAPKITESMLIYFSELYEEHLIPFKELNPTLTIKPKQHFLIHFPSVLRSNGPPTFNSCFKYELRNAFFKRGAHIICNFKNIAMSLSVRNQLSALSHSVNKTRTRDHCIKTHKFTPFHIHTLNGAQSVIEKFFVNPNESILCSVKAKIWGRQYSKGNFFAVRKRPVDKTIEFGQIQTIIWFEKVAYLLVKLFNTLGEDNSIHAYNLKEEAESKFLVLNVFELLDYHPLDGCMPFDDRKLFVKLIYAVLCMPL